MLLALLVLALLWIDGRGRLRHVHWQLPKPIAFDGSQWAASLPPRVVEQRQLLRTLERPLFSPSRRPPPPPPPADVAADASATTLAGVHLYGLYGAGTTGGAIVRIDGKDQRLAVNESAKGWKLVRIGDNGITLRRGAQERTIELVHVIPVPGAPAPAAPASKTVPPPAGARASRASLASPPATAAAAAAAPTQAAPDKPSSPPRYSGPQTSSPVKPANPR
ncbi:MAG: hypothetical protein WBF97_14725 [Comamonas sp.]